MAVPIIVPKATISMEEATILKWLKAEGEMVSRDDLLFELETDKAVMEVPAPGDGTVLRILIHGGPVKVEQIVGWIGNPGEHLDGDSATPHPIFSTQEMRPSAAAEQSSRPAAIAATPAARRRAKELGLDLVLITGTGPGGRITQEDVERGVQQPAGGAGAADQRQTLQDRGTLIRRLTSTWQTVPHIHIARLINAKGLVEAKSRFSSAVSLTDLILFLLARILTGFPELIRSWNGDHLEDAVGIHLSFAVDTDKGVVSPVIHDAASLSIAELNERRRSLAAAARAHRLKPDEVHGGVFTLTNLGMDDVDFFAPVINAPQTAILAIGRVAQQAVVVDGTLAIGWRMWANLAVDHRAADGKAAARLLSGLQTSMDQLPNLVIEAS